MTMKQPYPPPFPQQDSSRFKLFPRTVLSRGLMVLWCPKPSCLNNVCNNSDWNILHSIRLNSLHSQLLSTVNLAFPILPIVGDIWQPAAVTAFMLTMNLLCVLVFCSCMWQSCIISVRTPQYINKYYAQHKINIFPNTKYKTCKSIQSTFICSELGSQPFMYLL